MSDASKRSTANMARRHVVPGSTPLLDQVTGGGQVSRTLDLGLKPSGGGAVMASRAADQPNEHDYFPTPPWASRAGGELISLLDPAANSCWEPAAGGGHMAWGLREVFRQFLLSDIERYDGADWGEKLDFLSAEADGYAGSVDWIVSNPPFKLGEAFIRAAWKRARRGVAMLLRLQFIEGAGRHALFTRDCPLTMLAPFAERVPMVAGRWDPEASSATAYGWFLFLKPEAEAESPLALAIAGARVVGSGLVRIIPPGTKARLHSHADLVRFELAGPDPLFADGGGG